MTSDGDIGFGTVRVDGGPRGSLGISSAISTRTRIYLSSELIRDDARTKTRDSTRACSSEEGGDILVTRDIRRSIGGFEIRDKGGELGGGSWGSSCTRIDYGSWIERTRILEGFSVEEEGSRERISRSYFTDSGTRE